MIRQAFRGVLLLCFLQGSLSPQSQPSIPSVFQSEFARGQADRQGDHLVSAAQHFHSAAEIAAKTHDAKAEAKALLVASGVEIRLFRYQAALESANSAKRLALLVHDKTRAGAATSNVATVYAQLGVYVLAEQAAQEAIGLLQNSDRRDYLVRAMINAGDCQFELKQPPAIETLRNAVRLSRQGPGLKQVEAQALDHLGQVLFEHGDIAEASKILNEARTLKTELHDKGLALTDFTLAQLALKQEDYQGALRTLDRALASGSEGLSELPAFWVPQLRGEILEGLGNRSEALVSLQKAVNLADDWRLSALPGDLSGTQTVVTLDSVYRDFVELSAELSIERHDASLARQALTVLAKSRAADLREQMIAAFRHRLQLPPRYFELLSRLQTSEATLLGANSKQTPVLAESLLQTKNELSELQNQIGISKVNSPALPSKADERNLLTRLQHNLGPNQLLLSFSLGKKRSFLWGVSTDRVELYALPPESALAAKSSTYFSALQKGIVVPEGAMLSHDLLGQLAPALAAKKDWLIAADGVLLDQVPFAALPVIDRGSSAKTLIGLHSLRFLPSELLLINQKPPRPGSRFIGVADPIYNRADSRLGANAKPLAENHPNSVTLARLFGSGIEVRAAARLSGLSSTEILTGSQATEAQLRSALQKPPLILHFAVHVFNSTSEKWRTLEGAGDEALALSLTSFGIPELLTKEAVAGLRTPGALVVLSGCASQQGQIVPSAGLMGLSRAWLLAGAAAVIVTSWPTPDDSGGFFSAFYNHLRVDEQTGRNLVQRASAALQETQIDMQNTSDYRRLPSFWAAYSLISAE